MKLYTFDKAPNPQRLNLFMKYKGIELDTQQIDMVTGEHLKDAYKDINSECTVPCLVLEDGTLMSETFGIIHYLESLYPEKPLLGETDLEKAQVISWIHRLFMTGFMSVAEIFRNKSKAFTGRALPGSVHVPQITELIERGQIRLQAFFPQMEAHLTGRDYIVGNSITMADLDCYAIIGFSGWVKASIPDNCPNFQAWYARIKTELNN